jgi:uncharacterized protein (UPF0335 family)
MLEQDKSFSLEVDGASIPVTPSEAVGAMRVQASLQNFVERIQRLSEQRYAIGEDIKNVYLEAKLAGYDVAALKIVIRQLGQDEDELKQLDGIVKTYRRALNMQLDLL